MFVLSGTKLITIATAMIRQYGDAAYAKACWRARMLAEMKDEAGVRLWEHVAEAIKRELLRDSPVLMAAG